MSDEFVRLREELRQMGELRDDTRGRQSLLAELVRRQTAYGVLSVFNRTCEKIAEDLASDLLRDPAFRDELRELVKVAFTQALAELREPPEPRR
jgi:hypothetical protein